MTPCKIRRYAFRIRNAVACGAFVAAAVAQAPDPGLDVRFAAGDVADTRFARMVALYVPHGTAATPFVPAGEFEAQWSGTLRIDQRDRYRFTFSGIGRFSLELDGDVILEAASQAGQSTTSEPIRLNQGGHAFVATYRSIAGRDAQVRLEWESRRFGREPVPPIAFEKMTPGATGIGLRRARMTLATGRCVRCHDDPSLHDDSAVMPELRMTGPDLDGVGHRLEPAWIASWLRDPRAHRADARMPRVLHGDAATVERDAADLAAFLATLRRGPHWQGPTDGAVAAGGYLFADLGCIACHQMTDEARVETSDLLTADFRVARPAPIDLRGVDSKYRPGALAAFLKDPRRHDPWIRMPDFDLTDREAVDLAAFLRDRSKRVAAPPGAATAPRGDSQRGRTLFAAHRCAACHAADGITASPAKPLAEVFAGAMDRGCLTPAGDARASGAAPDYGFTELDRAGLRALAAYGANVLRQGPADEFVERQVQERRCFACHAIDHRTDDWTERASLLTKIGLDADVEAEPGEVVAAQHRPDLTLVGDKLRPDWMFEFFSGRLTERPRPWLRARMPTFPNVADGLATGFAAMHGHAPHFAPEPKAAAGSDRIGQRLVSAEHGFACVTCHAVGDKPPLAVFEVQGINLTLSGARLRPEFFERWMMDPPRIDPSSRMPRYADDAGRTAFSDVLEGDARGQFRAIWAFLRSVR